MPSGSTCPTHLPSSASTGRRRKDVKEGQPLLKTLAKSDAIFLPTVHWLGPSHVATPASNGCWEAGSAACLERGGDGSHSLKVFHKIPAALRDWSIYTRQSKVTVFGKQKLQNLSPSLYPFPVLPAGLESIPRCCRQKP